MTPLFTLLRRSFSGSITRGGRLGGLRVPQQQPEPQISLPGPPGQSGSVTPPPPPSPTLPTPGVPGAGSAGGDGTIAHLISDLQQSGKVHKETLALMEGSKEWQDYESNVNFEMNILRLRYAATPDAPVTPARRAQMQAHLRAVQAKVMEEHATEAAQRFVESLSSKEVGELRDMVGRLDVPGVGAAMAEAIKAKGEGYQSFQLSAEALKDTLWEVSSALGGGAGGGGGRGGGGGKR